MRLGFRNFDGNVRTTFYLSNLSQSNVPRNLFFIVFTKILVRDGLQINNNKRIY